MTFYIGYVINDIESEYTTSITGKSNMEKKLSTSVLEKADAVNTIPHWF